MPEEEPAAGTDEESVASEAQDTGADAEPDAAEEQAEAAPEPEAEAAEPEAEAAEPEAEAAPEPEAEAAPAEPEAEAAPEPEAEPASDGGEDAEKEVDPAVQEIIDQDTTVVHHKEAEVDGVPTEYRTPPGIPAGLDPGTLADRDRGPVPPDPSDD